MAVGLGQFWARLKIQCEKKLEDLTDKIICAKVTDYADYRESVGFVSGVRWVLNEARVVLGEDDKPNRPQENEDED